MGYTHQSYFPGSVFAPDWREVESWNRSAAETDRRQPEERGDRAARPREFIRNDSGAAVERFGLLGISGVVVDQTETETEFFNRPVFTGVAPDLDVHGTGQVAVIQRAASAGAVVECRTFGTTPILVALPDAAAYDSALPITGDTEKAAGALDGFIQLAYPISGGPGDVWGVANLQLGKPAIYVGEATETILGGPAVTTNVDLFKSDGTQLVAVQAGVTVVHYQPNYIVDGAKYPVFESGRGLILDNQSSFLEYVYP
jgi:hypothetical protein